MESIQGSVLHIVYTLAENGFTVAKFQIAEQKDPIVIVGILPSLRPGENLRCMGSWKNHPQHGKQFEVSAFEACIPTDILGIQRYLESGMIKGIGATYAKKIVKAFGIHTLDIIDSSPERLSEIPGIGPKRIEKILLGWKEQAEIRKILVFLRGHDVGPAFAQKIYRTYKEHSIAQVSKDPFSLIHTIGGIGFRSADKIAASLGITKHTPSRIDAGIEYLFQELSQEGHTCYPKDSFLLKAQTLLEIDEKSILERISFLLANRLIVAEEDTIASLPLAFAEQGICRELQRLLTSASKLRSFDSQKALSWVQSKLHLTLALEQQKAIEDSAFHKVLIITGGPGTGKSTITKAILRIFEILTSKILLVAPTGRAAKRMSEITHKKAFTIHSLLEMDFLSGRFQKNRTNPLSCDLLIVDESSMIDTRLMHSLLQAIPDHCRLIFIGDVDQLPSVGPGCVLQDLLLSETIPQVRLQRIFRQAAHSRIITNAHKINQGYFPDITPMPGSDFLFLPQEEPQEILQELLFRAKDAKTKNSLSWQILSPMRKGILGTENLNTLLQQTLNPSSSPFLQGNQCFHLHDKVMQIKNNYEKEVFNGDIGYITQIDKEEESIEVTFEDKPVMYNFFELDELVLAYAVSVHKYQGSECDLICMPLHLSHFKLLHRNLLYTAVTRGKKQVVLVGSKKALFLAVQKEDAKTRHTNLKGTLQKNLPLTYAAHLPSSSGI